VASGAVFTNSYQVADEFGNVILTPYTDVKIAITNGTFTATGTGSNPIAGGPGANPGETILPVDGTVDGAFTGSGAQTLTASVGAVVSSVPVTVTSSGTTVTFAAANTGSAVLFPGVPALVNTAPCDPTVPGTTCAESNLPNGASGTVTFGILSCTGVTVGVCVRKGGNNLVDLEANFKDAAGAPLYDALHPASITLHCTLANCPLVNDDSRESIEHHTAAQELQDQKVDDFNAYTPVAQLSFENALTAVPSCQPGNENNEYGAAIPAFSAVPDGRQVCADQTSFVRDSAGNLSATLYFYEDFKGSMG